MSAIYGGGQLSIFVGWIVVCILDEYAIFTFFFCLRSKQQLTWSTADVSHYLLLN